MRQEMGALVNQRLNDGQRLNAAETRTREVHLPLCTAWLLDLDTSVLGPQQFVCRCGGRTTDRREASHVVDRCD